MTLRESRTCVAVSREAGSSTSSFLINMLVLSDTRPSLWGGMNNCALFLQASFWAIAIAVESKLNKNSLWNAKFDVFNFSEQLLRDTVVEGKLAVQHCEEHNSQSPHITWFAQVWLPWKCRKVSKNEQNRTEFVTKQEPEDAAHRWERLGWCTPDSRADPSTGRFHWSNVFPDKSWTESPSESFCSEPCFQVLCLDEQCFSAMANIKKLTCTATHKRQPRNVLFFKI